jgi:hypothetical protein
MPEQGLSRGVRRFSTSSVCSPASAAQRAATDPAMPPPAMIRS